ncbi:hypothetical protein BKA64DRAFT_654354 [Cadophora sp. MPI-SDFR-AT-0126]|nr:hypothetical protein BKA64DRAFT_654354 [Leotiomycetes sp. MPI-SDFR-AT-0126]
MSVTRNPESVENQGEFHARIAPSEPLTTKGVSPSPPFPSNHPPTDNHTQHAPGVKVGNDAAPDFSAEILPAGTAPKDRSFKPDTRHMVPGQALNPDMSEEAYTPVEATIVGVTSKDVATGMGKPVYGQSSRELHGQGARPGKKQRNQVGARGGEQEMDA